MDFEKEQINRYNRDITEKDILSDELCKVGENIGTDFNFKRQIVWFPNVVIFAMIHLFGIYGWYLWLFKCKLSTTIFAHLFGTISAYGITAGAHRLYAHRTYKANLPLKILLLFSFTTVGQNSMYRWVLDHRQHHKYTDTDADPHNSYRGFFFSHIGWLMSRPHPLVQEKRKTIDMSDLKNDPLVMFEREYYYLLFFIFGFALPVIATIYFFNETAWNSFFVSFCWRYFLILNCTWTVNSLAHLWGTKPFDNDYYYMKPRYVMDDGGHVRSKWTVFENINPSENSLVAYISAGEGWHNYHHAFPWDYKTSEYGKFFLLSPTTYLIDIFAKFGWAYDLKTTSDEMIKAKILRTGDGTHYISKRFKND